MPLASAASARYQTKQELVYHTLRDAIMHGDLAPGERLIIEDIAHQLRVSPIPVREALQLLQAERLVENIPHVGATVARISRASLAEIFTVLEGLEIVGTRAAAQRMTPGEFQELESLLAQMNAAVETGQHHEWADLNTSFHRMIGRITAMPMLQEMTERVLGHWDRVRRHFIRDVLFQRIEQAQEEHHAILHAIQERDYPRLEHLIKKHNQGALAAYTAYLSEARPSREETVGRQQVVGGSR